MNGDVLDRFASGKVSKSKENAKEKKPGWMDIRKRGAQLSEAVNELIPAIIELNRNIKELNETAKSLDKRVEGIK